MIEGCLTGKHLAIVSIANGALLPFVVARCKDKISAVLSEPYSTPFRSWYESRGRDASSVQRVRDPVSGDDRESLDEEDLQKNVVYRFTRKISRYYTACNNIVRELVSLCRSGSRFTITIETVPFTVTTSTAEKENEYPDLGSFFADRLRTDLRTLQSKAITTLRDKWKHAWKHVTLHLHARMPDGAFLLLQPATVSNSRIHWRESVVGASPRPETE
jgi:hypothetical protein